MELCQSRVVSINKEDRKATRADDTWYKYVVGNGKSTIIGYRPGSREQVEENTEQFVTELNARSGRGGKSVFWSSCQHRKSAQKTTEAND